MSKIKKGNFGHVNPRYQIASKMPDVHYEQK